MNVVDYVTSRFQEITIVVGLLEVSPTPPTIPVVPDPARLPVVVEVDTTVVAALPLCFPPRLPVASIGSAPPRTTTPARVETVTDPPGTTDTWSSWCGGQG